MKFFIFAFSILTSISSVRSYADDPSTNIVEKLENGDVFVNEPRVALNSKEYYIHHSSAEGFCKMKKLGVAGKALSGGWSNNKSVLFIKRSGQIDKIVDYGSTTGDFDAYATRILCYKVRSKAEASNGSTNNINPITDFDQSPGFDSTQRSLSRAIR